MVNAYGETRVKVSNKSETGSAPNHDLKWYAQSVMIINCIRYDESSLSKTHKENANAMQVRDTWKEAKFVQYKSIANHNSKVGFNKHKSRQDTYVHHHAAKQHQPATNSEKPANDSWRPPAASNQQPATSN